MGNCTGKPKVTETNLAPEPAKEDTKVEGAETVEQVSKDVEVGEATTKVADEEKKDVVAPEGSLGVLLKEVKETTDDKTEAETVVAEPAKEEVKTETATGESSTEDAAKEPTVEPVKEEVKAEEPAVVVAPTEAAVPAVEPVKTEEKAETVPVPVEAPKTEAAAPAVEQPAAVTTDKPAAEPST